jgi:hypothetical protein
MMSVGVPCCKGADYAAIYSEACCVFCMCFIDVLIDNEPRKTGRLRPEAADDAGP